MSYSLGVDLGTTAVKAAVLRDGQANPEVAGLGSASAALPSAVLVTEDGDVLVGEAALLRAVDEPTRIARGFKRLLGDTTPILLGGSPWSAAALMAELLSDTVRRVTSAEGGPPSAVVLTHPASWGPYRLEQLGEVARIAGVDCPVHLLAEPVAAALHYAAHDRVPAGSVIAVYDLGGGTFDAAVVEVGADGSGAMLGQPEGLSSLGGTDADHAVLEHARSNAPHLFEGLDEDDQLTAAAFLKLNETCRQGKEALSEDTQASLVVALPTGIERIRITRTELEAAFGPQIDQSIEALRRAIGSAGITPAEVDRILLVGGASRMPLVGARLSAALARPVAIDADARHAISLGAAMAPVPRVDDPPPPTPPPPTPTPPPPTPTPPPPTPSPPAPPRPQPPAPRPRPSPGPPAPTRSAGPRRAAIAAAVSLVVAVLALALWPGGNPDGAAAPTTTAPEDTTTEPPASTTPTTTPLPGDLLVTFEPTTEGAFTAARTWEISDGQVTGTVVLTAGSDSGTAVHREFVPPELSSDVVFVPEPDQLIDGVATHVPALSPGETFEITFTGPTASDDLDEAALELIVGQWQEVDLHPVDGTAPAAATVTEGSG